METRTLGKTGIEVGVTGLGTEHLSTTRENRDAMLDPTVPADADYIDLVYNSLTDAHAAYGDTLSLAVHRQREGLVFCLHWGFVCHEPVDR
jgi:hypothetical protein